MIKIKERLTKFVSEYKQALITGVYGAVCGIICYEFGLKDGIKAGYSKGVFDGFCTALFEVATKKGGLK